jgi:hypothetical protein
VSLGGMLSSRGDVPSACPPPTSMQVPSIGGRKISDGAKFEMMDHSIGGRPDVESLKSRVEEQIEGVLDEPLNHTAATDWERQIQGDSVREAITMHHDESA